MNNSQTIRADVAVVGAGPAGIAAATVAAESGRSVVLLAVASYAVERGANVVAIAEQTSWLRYLRFGISVSLGPRKAREAIRLLRQLRHIPQYKSCWPVAACGRETLESVRLARGGTFENVPCDYLACGYHLVPCIEF